MRVTREKALRAGAAMLRSSAVVMGDNDPLRFEAAHVLDELVRHLGGLTEDDARLLIEVAEKGDALQKYNLPPQTQQGLLQVASKIMKLLPDEEEP